MIGFDKVIFCEMNQGTFNSYTHHIYDGASNTYGHVTLMHRVTYFEHMCLKQFIVLNREFNHFVFEPLPLPQQKVLGGIQTSTPTKGFK